MPAEGFHQRITRYPATGRLAFAGLLMAAACAGAAPAVVAESGSILLWQTPLVRANGFTPGAGREPVRLGVALLVADPYADLRHGLLTRIDLGGQTALALRPRAGRIVLTLTSRW